MHFVHGEKSKTKYNVLLQKQKQITFPHREFYKGAALWNALEIKPFGGNYNPSRVADNRQPKTENMMLLPITSKSSKSF